MEALEHRTSTLHRSHPSRLLAVPARANPFSPRGGPLSPSGGGAANGSRWTAARDQSRVGEDEAQSGQGEQPRKPDLFAAKDENTRGESQVSQRNRPQKNISFWCLWVHYYLAAHQQRNDLIAWNLCELMRH